jgi:hypothetical protein
VIVVTPIPSHEAAVEVADGYNPSIDSKHCAFANVENMKIIANNNFSVIFFI